ncbi:MAG: NHL repeat-containing protein [Candidatus Sericytochromatia bacterium]
MNKKYLLIFIIFIVICSCDLNINSLNIFQKNNVTNVLGNFEQLWDIVIDKSNNIYISDTYNNSIKQVNKDGKITKIISTGLKNPTGITLDSWGNLYIVDTGNRLVKKRNIFGFVETIISKDLQFALDIVINKKGEIFVSDLGSRSIKKFDNNGKLIKNISEGIEIPFNLALDNLDNLFFTDLKAKEIKKIDPTGKISKFFISKDSNKDKVVSEKFYFEANNEKIELYIPLDAPQGLFIDDLGNIYTGIFKNIKKVDSNGNEINYISNLDFINSFVMDNNKDIYLLSNESIFKVNEKYNKKINNSLVNFSHNTKHRLSNDKYGNLIIFEYDSSSLIKRGILNEKEIVMQTGLYRANALAIDKNDNLYITDNNFYNLDSIKKVDKDGNLLSLNKLILDLYNPSSITIDKKGNIFFINSGNGTLKKISPSGNITTITKDLNSSQGLAIDKDENIFYSDTNNNLIKKIDKNGWVSVVLSEGLNKPRNLIVNNLGDLYISDDGNNLIKKLDYKGNLSIVVSGLSCECSLALNNKEELYIAQNHETNLKKIDKSGNIISTDIKVNTNAIVFDKDNNLYYSDSGTRQVLKLNLDANKKIIYPSVYEVISDVITNSYNETYVLSRNYIKKFNKDGIISRLIYTGLEDQDGIKIDYLDNIYVFDKKSIKKIDNLGNISLINSSFKDIRSISIDKNNNIYVIDDTKLKKIQNSNKIIEIKSINLINPVQIESDSKGNLYINEVNKIMKIDTNEKISTILDYNGINYMYLNKVSNEIYFININKELDKIKL